MVVLFTAIFSTISIIEDRKEGFLLSVLVAPVSRSGLVLGKILGGATLASLQGFLFVLLAPIVAGISLSLSKLVLLVLGPLCDCFFIDCGWIFFCLADQLVSGFSRHYESGSFSHVDFVRGSLPFFRRFTVGEVDHEDQSSHLWCCFRPSHSVSGKLQFGSGFPLPVLLCSDNRGLCTGDVSDLIDAGPAPWSSESGMISISDLPHLNATLNGTSGILLVLGYLFIRRKQTNTHRVCMLGAFSASVLFLISYVIYHWYAGSRSFPGQGWVRPVYFSILISHVVLAVAIVPMALITLGRAWKEDFERHRRIARWTLPMWLYVSISGVIVYLMLYQARY